MLFLFKNISTFYSYFLDYVPSCRGLVPNLMVLFVITILEGVVPVSEGFVSVLSYLFSSISKVQL